MQSELLVERKPVASKASPSSQEYRPDIDGLRALSILLVVAFHAGITQLSGGFVGVDVFFVISGFLITGILLKEASATGTIRLRNFYARRIRRLLPLSAFVLVVTAAIGIMLVPSLDRATLLADARSAALYISNWRFAGQATAYADTGPADSLFVHYWSLSIEEQFYLLWPLIILVTARWVMRRDPAKLPRALGSVLIGLAVSTFVLSVVLTRVQGQSAYYATHLRLGELATGAAIAVLAVHAGKIRGRVADLAGIAGFACILLAAVLFGRRTPYPGSAVLLPVVGTALVIASGVFRPAAVGRFLGRPPLPAIGRISYAWYLWHWPALGVASLALGEDASPGERTVGKMFAIVASFLLAIASHHIIENPIRFSARLKRSAGKGLALGAGLTAISLAITMLPTPTAATRPVGVPSGRTEAPATAKPMTPLEARNSIVRGMGSCHANFTATAAPSDCLFGDRHGDKTIALIGDSVAQQWFPAFQRAAVENHWRLLAWTKSACPIVDVHTYNPRLNRPYRECVTWRENVIDRLGSAPGGVDLVVIGRAAYAGANVLSQDDAPSRQRLADTWEDGATRTFSRLRKVADRVIALRDTPVAPNDIPGCLSDTATDPEGCSFSRAGTAHRDSVIAQAERAAAPAGVQIVDMTQHVCPSDPCPVVTPEGLIIYRDRHHLTARFSVSLAGVIARLVSAAL